MRVTDQSRMLMVTRVATATASRLNDASRQAAAGATVLLPSDDPVAFAAMVRKEAALVDVQSRSRSSRAAGDELGLAERSLESGGELMTEARTLAIQGANETLAPGDRATLAERVKAIREQLLQIGNSRGSNGYIFGGTKNDAPPFDVGGNFLGNDEALLVPVGNGVTPRGNASGAKAFTAAGGRDVLGDLAALATALQNNDVATVRTGIDWMEAGNKQVVDAQVELGLGMDRFRTAADLLDGDELTVSEGIARDRGSNDTAAILTRLSAMNQSYSQSLEVTRQILSLPSLARM
jgi:flagellar hook-associated protein 3 FlgL